MRVFAGLALSIFLCCCVLNAQDNPTPSSRAEEIENAQSAKQQTLSPDVPDPAERRFVAAEKDVRHVIGDPTFRLQFGGLPTPSGFAMGPTLHWQNEADRIRMSTWAIGSIRGFYSVGTGLEVPRFVSRRLNLKVEAAHLDMPQLDFYGEGPHSLKSQRTDYRREDTRFDLGLNWMAKSHLKPACNVEQLLLNVGPGTSDAITSTNLKFGPAQAPGIDVQSNFLIAGCGVQIDFRDSPDYPHKGPAVFLGYRRFEAENLSQYSFHRANGSVQEYIPFFNQKRVIVLRAVADMTFHNHDQVVPFYMQRTLGGFSDLRGFRYVRFYDDNAFVMNAEYRWQVCTDLDLALFADSGEVFHRPSQFSTSNLRNDVGFGFRFNTPRSMLMRVDAGFSREGFAVWVAFDKVF